MVGEQKAKCQGRTRLRWLGFRVADNPGIDIFRVPNSKNLATVPGLLTYRNCFGIGISFVGETWPNTYT